MLNLREILAQRFEAHLELLSVLERAPLLELINLFQQWNTLHASLLGIVAQMAQAIPHPRSDLNHLFKGVHLALQDLSEDLVDVVGVTTIDSDLQSLKVVSSLQIERNLLHDLLLVQDQEVGQLTFVVLRQLGQLGEVDAKLDLVQNVVATDYDRLGGVEVVLDVHRLQLSLLL